MSVKYKRLFYLNGCLSSIPSYLSIKEDLNAFTSKQKLMIFINNNIFYAPSLFTVQKCILARSITFYYRFLLAFGASTGH